LVERSRVNWGWCRVPKNKSPILLNFAAGAVWLAAPERAARTVLLLAASAPNSRRDKTNCPQPGFSRMLAYARDHIRAGWTDWDIRAGNTTNPSLGAPADNHNICAGYVLHARAGSDILAGLSFHRCV